MTAATSNDVGPRASAIPCWTRRVLVAAGVYNLLWGAAVVFAPLLWFRVLGMEAPRYPSLWQCVGMIVGVYGVGYLIAAANPVRHWPIVFVGLLGKLFGPLGFLKAAWSGELPWNWGWLLLLNDLIWWVPFAAILYHVFRVASDTSQGCAALPLAAALDEVRGHRNFTLGELSDRAPTLVVFLRHAGCTFCREALAEMEERKALFQRAGVTLAIVHMGKPMDGTLTLYRHGLEFAHHFSDPNCTLYRAFGLSRGSLGELVSPTVALRGLSAMLRGHGLGKIAGDGFRMPGAFVLIDRKIAASHIAAHAADQPDYAGLLKAAAAQRTAAAELTAATL
ncbi:MAG: redoxin domain-containing protein [Planctomycetales bacterium]|nr:redoxin domain-containing protein [Planctomycetales bacterium]